MKTFIAYIFFCFYFIYAQPVVAEKTFTVATAEKSIRLTGYTRSSRSITLTSEVAGKALKVNYKIGDTITDENAFIEIDPTFVNFKIKKSRLQLQQVESRIKILKSKINYLKKGHKRMKELRKNKNISKVKYEEATQKLVEAIHEREALKCEKKMINLSVNELKEELTRYKITSLVGGTITSCIVEEGEFVRPGTPLAVVSDYSTLVVPFSLSGEEVNALRNLPEEFPGILDGNPVKATINFINPKFDEKTRKLELELAIGKYNGHRRGGLNFSTTIRVKTDGIMLPREAVKNRFGNPSVILKKNLEKVPVMILGESGSNLIGAKSKKLVPGTRLMPASSVSGG